MVRSLRFALRAVTVAGALASVTLGLPGTAQADWHGGGGGGTVAVAGRWRRLARRRLERWRLARRRLLLGRRGVLRHSATGVLPATAGVLRAATVLSAADLLPAAGLCAAGLSLTLLSSAGLLTRGDLSRIAGEVRRTAKYPVSPCWRI